MIKVWDLYIRLSHWLAVLLIISAWLSANFGDAEFKWHSLNGYALLILAVSRIIWGFVGSSSAQFSHFVKSPMSVVSYLKGMFKGNAPTYSGHNPAGGWMVIALLLALVFQAITGMFSSDDILAEGPFAFAVSSRMVSKMTALHHLGFDLLIVLISLHVLAVLYHQFVKKEALIKAMFNGTKPVIKPVMKGVTHEVFIFKPLYFALIVVSLVALSLWLVLNYYA